MFLLQFMLVHLQKIAYNAYYNVMVALIIHEI